MTKVKDIDLQGCDGIKLEGVLAESQESDLLVILTPGITSNIKDYNHFMEQASLGFSMLGYTLRGHEGSEGQISFEKSVADLKEIVMYSTRQLQAGRVAFAGHSIGAAISKRATDCDETGKVLAMYSMAAYPSIEHTKYSQPVQLARSLGLDRMPAAMDKAVTSIVSRVAQRYIESLRIDSLKGFISYLTDSKMSESHIGIPVGFAFAADDEVLGLDLANQRQGFKEFFSDPKIFGNSTLHFYEGVNHCFNVGPYAPFAGVQTPDRFYEELHSFINDNIINR